VLCSGKVAYDLMEAREKERLEDVSIVRLEQLYPFPGEPLAARLADDRPRGSDLVPGGAENNGAWFFVESQIEDGAGRSRAHRHARELRRPRRRRLARHRLASRHAEQQQALVSEALGVGS
jgi:2-oxoglutarate dehydrogenase E1 component